MAIVLMGALSSFGQNTKWDKFLSLSCPEKRWVVTHPFIASKAMRLSEQAKSEANSMLGTPYLDHYSNGGKLDAFRHCYWMALLCMEMNWRKARKLGKAHERGNKRDFKKGALEEGYLPDKISITMDLWNNEVGIRIGREDTSLSSAAVKENVIKAIQRGECKIIRRDVMGNFLDCNGMILQENEWIGMWENNRCLIPSNH